MSAVHCFTSISFSYLSRARILARTIRKFHPSWVLWVCISDKPPAGLSLEGPLTEFDRIVFVDELAISHLDSWVFKHNVVELCTAVKGLMLVKILEEGAGSVIYLDPDIALLGPLQDLDLALDTCSIVLTPHQCEPEHDGFAISDNERSSLKFGTYNLGFIAVRNDGIGEHFAAWWRDRLKEFCFEEVEAGLFTDQKWCDLVPAYFDRVTVLRDPGYNVASWNLSNRTVRLSSSGELTVNDRPLRFFHFTKIDRVGEHMIERYSKDLEVFELIAWYKRMLSQYDCGVPTGWWHYGSFADGEVIPQEARRLYRSREDLQDAFPHPFASGAGTFQSTWPTIARD